MIRTDIRRGDIFYVKSDGSKTPKARPAIIVSNNLNNLFSEYVTVVYLTSQAKKPLPTHVAISCKRPSSTALCEGIHTIPKESLTNYVKSCSYSEIKHIDQALLCALGIDTFAYTFHNLGFILKRFLKRIYMLLFTPLE